MARRYSTGSPLPTVAIRKPKQNEVVVNARFIENGKEAEVISNNYFFTRYKDIDFPKVDIQMISVPAGNGYDVTVRSDVFARPYSSASTVSTTFSPTTILTCCPANL